MIGSFTREGDALMVLERAIKECLLGAELKAPTQLRIFVSGRGNIEDVKLTTWSAGNAAFMRCLQPKFAGRVLHVKQANFVTMGWAIVRAGESHDSK